MLALAVGVVVVASYPVLSLVAATALVGLVAVARVLVARIERSSMKVSVPGFPVEVTVARTTRD
ncbi:dehydrogenase [Haloferax profundi]|uniref:Dehydrogenase n=1 Tax=Haloferax profundi TaxID=1544718 RepID=A0A0W1R3G0_9EURY|nr:dehydrogenase [Haloferax profundi]